MTSTQALTDPLATTLSALETLHEREAQVLKSMKRDELDDISAEKERLCEELRTLSAATPLTEQHRPALERLRRRATLNQLLVVHARDAVRTILANASGTPPEAFPGARKPTVQDGVRVNLRG